MSNAQDPDVVRIFDTTLRDGEQAPGIALTRAEKVEIAEQLARLGVDVLEAGFPVSSDGEFEAVREIASSVRGPVIAALARVVPGDIDRAAEALRGAERWRIHTFISTSDIHMNDMLRMSQGQVLDAIRDGVKLAVGHTDDVEFSAQDATRTELEFLLECFRVAVEAGATTINVPDTVGYAMPHEFGELVRTVREAVPDHVVISTHCHNDLGLAVANSLAAVAAGAPGQDSEVAPVNVLPGGTVTDVSFIGVSTQYLVRMPWDQEVAVFEQNTGTHGVFKPGDPVNLNWRPEYTFLLDAKQDATAGVELKRMLEAPSAPLWWAIRAVLAVVGVASLGVLGALLALEPRGSRFAYGLAVAGCVLFCIQTALLDAIVWPAFFPFP